MRKPEDPEKHAKRHMHLRGGIWHYKRRVPSSIAEADQRAPVVRISLKTGDLGVAMLKRDMLEAADDELWGALLSETPADQAMGRYKAAVKRVEALGFTYRSAMDLARHESIQVLQRRLEIAMDAPDTSAAEVMGGVEKPSVTVSMAFKAYKAEIVAHELVGKSQRQRASWAKVKQRAVTNFTKLCGDIAMTEITRDHALKFYNFWMARVAPPEGAPTHGGSSGNRDVGNMRDLYRRYFAHIGERDRQNPFEGLSFEVLKRSRPPFTAKWLSEKFLAGDALGTLNPQARAIVYMMIETGCRPSELANLTGPSIRLDDEVPHILVEPRTDPDDPREIKTTSSIRTVPLVGIALEAAKLYPEGFSRYYDREGTLSGTLNKMLKTAKLLPTPRHSAYSIRHSFEDRMKEGRVDEELRRMLMGHVIDRPKYGSGFALRMQKQALDGIVLPYEPAIVSALKEAAASDRPRRRASRARPQAAQQAEEPTDRHK